MTAKQPAPVDLEELKREVADAVILENPVRLDVHSRHDRLVINIVIDHLHERNLLNTAQEVEGRKFSLGDSVRKTKGSQWNGKIVGFYSTELTRIGYCVESNTEKGSVQIYPEAALELTKGKG